MKIRVLWERSVDVEDCAWVVSALDEYSDDAGGGDEFYEALQVNADMRREMVIEVPDAAVYALFAVPTIKATVCDSPSLIRKDTEEKR